MRAEHTADYSAPLITDQRGLQASMMPGLGSLKFEGDSDAEIKHGARPVTGYEAPEITDQRALDGQLRLRSDLEMQN